MYVSYVDESGKGGPVFVVGGLTAKADPSWLDFSTEWRRILDLPPCIPYFHLSESQGLSEEEHDRKITALIELINCFVERGDLLVIHVEQYKAFFRGKIGTTFDNPFHQGYIHIFQQCAVELPDPNGKVDFVFDQLGDTEYLELLSAYRTFKEICPNPAVKKRFGEEPIRRNDEIVLPLQASDLFAGLMRRAYEGDRVSFSYLKKITIDNRAFQWDERALGELYAKSQARAPGLGLELFYEGKKMRSKRLGDARKLLRSAPK
jgi:hypothetical protein